MLINMKNGEVRCPFCGSINLGVNYSCNTSGREWGTVDEYGDTYRDDSETTEDYDFEYEMSCCNASIYRDYIEDILTGAHCMDDEPDEGWDDDGWDDDGENEDENNSIQDPVKALFKHLTK